MNAQEIYEAVRQAAAHRVRELIYEDKLVVENVDQAWEIVNMVAEIACANRQDFVEAIGEEVYRAVNA
jgi:hypothetical protein